MGNTLLFLLLFTAPFASPQHVVPPPSAPPPSPAPVPPSSSPRVGVDFIGPLWLPRTFKMTCCRGGTPVPENNLLIQNWTQKVSSLSVEEAEESCHVFEGSFLLAASALFNLRTFVGYGVQCKCTGETATALDKHCRKLPPCQNNGYRSFSLNMRCACPEPFFGDFCEKYCDQGQKLKGVDGRDYCSCVPFYQGEECRNMVCLNGGVEAEGRCVCPPNFLGYHCEIDTNRTALIGGTRYQKYGEVPNEFFTRDVSGTIFSLVMIIVLVVSMYLLMKHRMQGRVPRREEAIRTMYGYARNGESIRPDGLRSIPISALGIQGPPPYAPVVARGRAPCELLPPLPTYDDATKLPPLRQGGRGVVGRVSVEGQGPSSPPPVPPVPPVPPPSHDVPLSPPSSAVDASIITRSVSTRQSI